MVCWIFKKGPLKESSLSPILSYWNRLAPASVVTAKIDFSAGQEEQVAPNPFAIFREKEGASKAQQHVQQSGGSFPKAQSR